MKEENKKQVYVMVRCSKEDKEVILQAAKKENRSISNFILTHCKDKAMGVVDSDECQR